MSVLPDAELHAVHSQAVDKLQRYLTSGHTTILGEPTRIARAAEREILSRAKYHKSKINA